MEQPLRVRPAPAPRLAAWAPRRQEIIAAQPRLPVPAVVGDSASRCLSLQVRLFSSCEAGGLVLLQLMGHRAWRRPPPALRPGVVPIPTPPPCAGPCFCGLSPLSFLGKGGHFLQSVPALPLRSALFCRVTSDSPTKPATR